MAKRNAGQPPKNARGVRQSHTPTRKKGLKVTGFAVPINHQVEEVKTVYSNHFAVQFEQSVYRLLFFEVQPPLIFQDQEGSQEKLESITSVNAQCVARVVIPSHMMQKVVEALVTNLQQSLEAVSATASQELKLTNHPGSTTLVAK